MPQLRSVAAVHIHGSMVSAATTPGWRLARSVPGAAIQGNSRTVVAFYRGAQFGRGQLHGGRFRGDLHRFDSPAQPAIVKSRTC